MAEQTIQLTKLASCAGCGAKVGAGVLAQLLGGLKVHSDPRLLVGFDKSDDASVYQVTDELALVQTVDFFPPIADDPYLFGQIAATNALSDVYAMGGEPKLALNLLCIPESMPKEAVHQLLRGGYDKAYEAGVIITGGHSILDPEPKYGLAVTGFVHPKKLLTNSAARPGDVLLLTKPLGIGVLTTAAKAELASPEAMALAHRLMTTLNKAARDCMVRYAVHACTDVTGFGLLGHAFEMAQASDTHLTLFPGEIDLIPEALELARDGILPAGMYRNRHYAEAAVDPGSTELAVQDMLYEELFKGGPLSKSILGTPESLDAITHDDIKNYIAREYTLDNIVVSVAGNFDADQICQQFEHSLSCMTASKEDKNHESAIYIPSFRTKIKDIEQSHICLGTRALKFGDEDVYALTILNNIMGGSMSSRLFQNIREEKGMAYTVYSYTASYSQEGLYAISAGVAHDKIEDTVYAIREELEKLTAGGVTDDELRISKEQTKGSYIFSLENTGSRMVSNGKYAINCNIVRNPEDVIRQIDAVDHDDIRRMAGLITDVGTYSGTLVSKRDVDLASLMK